MAKRSPMPDGPPSLTTRLGRAPIVVAAAKVFARSGFADTRVEDVLAAAGVARRTFYRYFASKEDVLAAVYELAATELVNAMRSLPKDDPIAALRHGLDLYLDYHVENGALLRVLIEQAVASDSPLAAPRRQFRAALVSLMDEAVRATTGEKHPPILYLALISALEGASLELVAAGATARDVAEAKRVMRVILTRVLAAPLLAKDPV